MITASHNPPQYNGYKVYWEHGGQAAPAQAAEIFAKIRCADYFAVRGMEEREAIEKGLLMMIGEEIDEAYYAATETLLQYPELMRVDGKELKLVYTPLHGSGCVPVRTLLARVGVAAHIVPEQEKPDPAFPTVKAPNPEDPDAFTLAVPLADRIGADAILATDPDSDRLGVAVRKKDGAFDVLTGNQIGSLLLHYLLSARKEKGTLPENGIVAKSLVSTRMADAICARFGVACKDVPTGFRFISEVIDRCERTGEQTFLFGFEESYGFLSSTFVRDKDGVNASLLIAELAADCKAKGITLYDRLQEIFARYGVYVEKVVSTVLPGKDGVARMQEIMKGLRAEHPKEIGGLAVTAVRDYLKGVRVADGVETPTGLPASDVLYFELEGGNWVCVRPSGTEPKIKLYVNTNDKDGAAAHALSEKLCAASEAMMK